MVKVQPTNGTKACRLRVKMQWQTVHDGRIMNDGYALIDLVCLFSKSSERMTRSASEATLAMTAIQVGQRESTVYSCPWL